MTEIKVTRTVDENDKIHVLLTCSKCGSARIGLFNPSFGMDCENRCSEKEYLGAWPEEKEPGPWAEGVSNPLKRE